MKKYIGILIIAAAYSCNQPSSTVPEKKMEPMAVKDTTKNDLVKLAFASPKDLSCGMPISAGVSDTATYKGKLYGFCSAECKEDFLKNAEALLKAK
ncbi:YHS domain-containing protein [Ferruginibacter sp. SUN106]|uniref:YHS domain-containing protein n=1 Tax=Ferruginibacter sp. SUN106 TaxID=2978348 RepID=UPI003D363686